MQIGAEPTANGRAFRRQISDLILFFPFHVRGFVHIFLFILVFCIEITVFFGKCL